MTAIPRSQWVRALMTHPTKTVIELVDELTRDCEIRHRSLPQSGLMLMRMQEGVHGEDYNLGEIPVASACLEIVGPDGTRADGAAQVLDDSQELAVALAACDAILSASSPGAERVAELVERGARELKSTEQQRAAMRNRTVVDFDLLSTVETNSEGES